MQNIRGGATKQRYGIYIDKTICTCGVNTKVSGLEEVGKTLIMAFIFYWEKYLVTGVDGGRPSI